MDRVLSSTWFLTIGLDIREMGQALLCPPLQGDQEFPTTLFGAAPSIRKTPDG